MTKIPSDLYNDLIQYMRSKPASQECRRLLKRMLEETKPTPK